MQLPKLGCEPQVAGWDVCWSHRWLARTLSSWPLAWPANASFEKLKPAPKVKKADDCGSLAEDLMEQLVESSTVTAAQLGSSKGKPRISISSMSAGEFLTACVLGVLVFRQAIVSCW